MFLFVTQIVKIYTLHSCHVPIIDIIDTNRIFDIIGTNKYKLQYNYCCKFCLKISSYWWQGNEPIYNNIIMKDLIYDDAYEKYNFTLVNLLFFSFLCHQKFETVKKQIFKINTYKNKV